MVKRGMSKKLYSKAQYATEVLMTYGWALILISGVLAALFYFDILSLQDMKPDICTLSPGLVCDEISVTEDGFKIKIVNGMGADVTINNLELINQNVPGQICSEAFGSDNIPNGASKQINITCVMVDTFESGHKQMFDLDFKYTILGQQFLATGKVFTYVAK